MIRFRRLFFTNRGQNWRKKVCDGLCKSSLVKAAIFSGIHELDTSGRCPVFVMLIWSYLGKNMRPVISY